jgi:hypothetical protein
MSVSVSVRCVGLSMVLLAASAQADSGVEFTGSGFMTLAVGKMIGGERGQVADYACPCFVADYGQGGVYDGRGGVQWRPDSKLGWQGTASFLGADLSLTAQVVARGAQSGSVDLEWVYANYHLTDNTSLQFGRKRLPMFYYSDIQDVGFSLPWTHLPPQLYGWEVINYNGLNLSHKARFGDWATTLNVLAGSESAKDSGYWRVYNGARSRTDVKWSDILGAEMLFSHDWLEARLVYIQSKTQRTNTTGVWNGAAYAPTLDPYLLGQVTRQQIYSAALNLDYEDWLARTEFIYINRPGASFRDNSRMMALGRRLGAWQVLVTHSRYYSQPVAGGNPLGQEGHSNRALTVRYDLTETRALKIQLDDQLEQGGPQWVPRFGNARLLSLAYDQVFR